MKTDLDYRVEEINGNIPEDHVFPYDFDDGSSLDKRNFIVWVNPEYPTIKDYVIMGEKLKEITKEFETFSVIFIGKTKAKSTAERRDYLKFLFNELPNLEWAYFVFERGFISTILLRFIMGRNFKSFSIHSSIKDVFDKIK